jgi:hypothetical protein
MANQPSLALLEIAIPIDREGEFEPQVVKPVIEDQIMTLYANFIQLLFPLENLRKEKKNPLQQ